MRNHGSRREVARICRVANKLGVLDIFGHLSVRLPRNEGVAVSPRPSSEIPTPAAVSADDVVLVDSDGLVIEGDGEPPSQVHIDLALYRSRPDVNAVLLCSPPAAIAFGITGRDPLPVTHSEAAMIYEASAMIQLDSLVVDEARGSALAREIGSRDITHLRGLGLLLTGRSLPQLLRRAEAYDDVARLSEQIISLTPRPRVVSRQEAKAVAEELRRHAAPLGTQGRAYNDIGSYFATLDTWRPTSKRPAPTTPTDVHSAAAQLALACRILAAHPGLVDRFEHVSIRNPDSGRSFLMNPVRQFSRMRPADIITVGMDRDATWLQGRLPPAPFARFHRDIFAARADVGAIVHTHNTYLRAVVSSGRRLEPVFRNGAAIALLPLPVLEKPTMLFDRAMRSQALKRLGSASVLHSLAHGTDHLAQDLRKAAVAAIHLEQLGEFLVRSQRLGEPHRLVPGLIADLERYGPAPEDWWNYYATRLKPTHRPTN